MALAAPPACAAAWGWLLIINNDGLHNRRVCGLRVWLGGSFCLSRFSLCGSAAAAWGWFFSFCCVCCLIRSLSFAAGAATSCTGFFFRAGFWGCVCLGCFAGCATAAWLRGLVFVLHAVRFGCWACRYRGSVCQQVVAFRAGFFCFAAAARCPAACRLGLSFFWLGFNFCRLYRCRNRSRCGGYHSSFTFGRLRHRGSFAGFFCLHGAIFDQVENINAAAKRVGWGWPLPDLAWTALFLPGGRALCDRHLHFLLGLTLHARMTCAAAAGGQIFAVCLFNRVGFGLFIGFRFWRVSMSVLLVLLCLWCAFIAVAITPTAATAAAAAAGFVFVRRGRCSVFRRCSLAGFFNLV